MAAPQPTRTAPSIQKTPIDLDKSLLSALRLWLASRDQLLWILSGDADERIQFINPTSVADLVKRMNDLAVMARGIAALNLEPKQTEKEAVNQALDRLLEAEAPQFSLRIDAIPGSF